MKKIAPRISDNAAKFLAANFKSTNAGAEYILDSLPILFLHLKKNLKGKFLKGELSLMIDTATMISPESVGRHLYMNIQDGIELEELDVKWEVSAGKLREKFHALSMSEQFYLEIWANSFWYGPNEGNKFDDYVEGLL